MDESPERWAERRDGLVSVLADGTTGIRRTTYASRIRTKRWKQLRRGVAKIDGTPATWRQSVRAAVMSAGPGAFVSHVSGVAMYGAEIRGVTCDLIQLSARRSRQMRMEGVQSHRFLNLEDGDVIDRWGIPTASPLRLVVDLSGHLDDGQLGRLIDDFLRRGLLDLSALRQRIARLKPARGRSIPRLRRVLAERPGAYAPGDSELEGRILRLLAREGFPAPVSQYWVRAADFKARIDHAFPTVQLFIESDGFGWHQFPSDLDGDSQRRNDLVTHGWRPLTFTWRMSDAAIIKTMDAVYDRSGGKWRLPLAQPLRGMEHQNERAAEK